MKNDTFELALNSVTAAGVKISESLHSDKSFGSWHIAVKSKPKRRLIWDGKDAFLVAQIERIATNPLQLFRTFIITLVLSRTITE